MDRSPLGPSMGFLRQEYWSGKLPFPSPGNLPNLGIEPRSPALQANSLPSEPQGKPLTGRAHSKSKTFGSKQWLGSYGCTHTHLHTYARVNFLEELVLGLSYTVQETETGTRENNSTSQFLPGLWTKGMCPVSHISEVELSGLSDP